MSEKFTGKDLPESFLHKKKIIGYKAYYVTDKDQILNINTAFDVFSDTPEEAVKHILNGNADFFDVLDSFINKGAPVISIETDAVALGKNGYIKDDYEMYCDGHNMSISLDLCEKYKIGANLYQIDKVSSEADETGLHHVTNLILIKEDKKEKK